MSETSNENKRKLYFFGFRWHAPVAAAMAVVGVFAVPLAVGAIDSRIRGMYIPLVTVIWGFGFYFAMSAIMVDEPLLRFIGLMSFAVLEWGYFALMTTVNSTVSHPLLRILGF